MISNVSIDDTTANDPVALFTQVSSSGSISDLNLSNFGVVGTGSDTGSGCEGVTGGLVAKNLGLLSNNSLTSSTVSAQLSGTSCDYSATVHSYLGGLVAHNEGAVKGSYSSAAVTSALAASYVGGLIGFNDYEDTVSGSAAVSNSYATGAVSGTGSLGSPTVYCIGGLIGYDSLGAVSNSYATGAVSGNSNDNTGGLIGWNVQADISGSHATGGVSDASGILGGLIGYNTVLLTSPAIFTILNSYATGSVTGISNHGYDDNTAGGLIGFNSGGNIGGEIGSVYDIVWATGAVSIPFTDTYAGGLVGQNHLSPTGIGARIEYAYATGSVSGGATMGSLVGLNSGGTILQSFATGFLTTNSALEIGGLVGLNVSDGSYPATVTDSYSLGTVTNDGSGGDTGGFVGENYYLMGTAVATTATSYEVGTVTASYGTCSGEYVGAGATDKGYMSGLNTYAYYDNTNNYNSLPGAGCPSGDSGISELPSSGVPSGFSTSIWGWASGTNCGYPYLLHVPPGTTCEGAESFKRKQKATRQERPSASTR